MYGEDPWASNVINFDVHHGTLKPKGHVIACRVTAENPDEGKDYFVSRRQNSSFDNGVNQLPPPPGDSPTFPMVGLCRMTPENFPTIFKNCLKMSGASSTPLIIPTDVIM